MSTPAQRYTLVREAALKAVAELPHHATLGEAEIAAIAQQTSGLGRDQLQAYVADAARTLANAAASPAFNLLSATPQQLAAYHAANGLPPPHDGRGLARSSRMADASGGRSEANGARFDRIGEAKTTGDWNAPAWRAEMRALAIHSGLGWAATNPDILRLGRPAIEALAAVNMQQRSYQRLTTEAGFKAKDVVTLATYAKKKNIDANKLSDDFADLAKGLTPEERARLHRDGVGHMARPEHEAARQKFHNTLEKIRRDHPEKAPQVERVRERMQLKVNKTNAAEANAAGAVVAARAKENHADATAAEKNANLAAFKSPAPAAAPQSMAQGEGQPQDQNAAAAPQPPKTVAQKAPSAKLSNG